MSVVAGLWSFRAGLDVPAICGRMLDNLKIYSEKTASASAPLSPEDVFTWPQRANPALALGHLSFPAVPKDRYDRQPMQLTPALTMVADARVDNRDDLARDLGLDAACTATTADSELLGTAWLRWGEASLEQLTGAFSFALWDAEHEQLVLARDHTGERPLYYHHSAECFAFASMPVGLHPVPAVGAEIDEDYVARYLTLVTMPVERTIFRRMVRLPAGHLLTFRRDGLKITPYWSRHQLPELRFKRVEEYVELLREQFDAAVRARLRTTGNVGSQLSGGLDSSAVAATAARLLSPRELTAYTAVPRAGFQEGDTSNHFGDEGPAAAEIAALYPNMRHVRVDSAGSDLLGVIDRNNALYNHPCFGPSNEVWSNAILDCAQQAGITVLLNGNCGNSTISSYGMPALAWWFRTGRWLTLLRVAWELRRAHSASIRSIARQSLLPLLPFPLRRVADPYMRNFSLDYSVVHPEIAARLDLERLACRSINETAPHGRGLLETLLTYGDVSETAMAAQGGWGIDFRDPTFDRRIVEFCLRVPLEQFVHGGQLRSLARRAFADRLPPSTIARNARGRQSADWYLALAEMRPRLAVAVEELTRSPLASRMLDLSRMRALIANWPTSGFNRPEIHGPYHIALLRGISVGRFLRSFDPGVS